MLTTLKMKIQINLLIALVLLSFTACEKVKEKTKSTINEGGEVVGKTATEFIEGVSEGVDKTLQCEIVLSKELVNKGLKTGQFSINNEEGGNNNILVLYIIFDRDFNQELTAKSFNKNGLENGRTKIAVDGKAGEAKYYDFVFDRRTYIEAKSKITIE
jgi:hypothetical protein